MEIEDNMETKDATEMGYVEITLKDGTLIELQCDYFEASKLIPGFIDFFSDQRDGELTYTLNTESLLSINIVYCISRENTYEEEFNDES
jgi:hypothetical protein